jgi:hypothetical protein
VVHWLNGIGQALGGIRAVGVEASRLELNVGATTPGNSQHPSIQDDVCHRKLGLLETVSTSFIKNGLQSELVQDRQRHAKAPVLESVGLRHWVNLEQCGSVVSVLSPQWGEDIQVPRQCQARGEVKRTLKTIHTT